MNSVIKEVCNFIDDSDIYTYRSIGEAIGATKQQMSNFKTNGSLGFEKLLKLSSIVCPSNPQQKISDWCLDLVSVESIKQAIEYAAITRNIPLLGNLIAKHKKEKGIIEEYISVYSIMLSYMINEISGYSLVDRLQKLGKFKDKPLNILVSIFKCYGYYFKKKFHLMLDTANELIESVMKMSDKRDLFMKECYIIRFAEIMAPTHLHLNNLKSARFFAEIIIKSEVCAKTVSDASYILGMSYILEDKSLAINRLQESYDIAKKAGDSAIEEEARLNLAFAQNFYSLESACTEPLEKIKGGLLQGEEDDFLMVLQNKDSDLDSLYKLYRLFFTQSNFYFASLVAKIIHDRGEKGIMLEQMMLFNSENNEEKGKNYEKITISSFNRSNLNRRSLCA